MATTAVVILLLIWLPARLRFFLNARAVRQIPDAEADLDVIALRAMVTQPLRLIASISSDPRGHVAVGTVRCSRLGQRGFSEG